MSITTAQVSPESLVPNPWNTNVVSPDNEVKLEESIRKFGMFKPAVVRELVDGTLQIIGGQHRVQAAIRLGLKQIPVVNLGVITEIKAKEISLVDNGRFGEDDSLKLAELIGELGAIDDLTKFMPYSEADLNSIFSTSSIVLDELDSLELPERDIELPDVKGTQTHQVMRFKVPLEDVDAVTKVIEKTIKSQGFGGSDSLTNAGDALVHLLLK
ncbi:ParB/RepB/Spo0J family partition protein [Acinetobacter brisouii]|uniref:ParB/RepB/Spo0J family partition protein n=1 Tax=Acinetobacter brisouii TaxID=396323 RepID=UPI00124F0680|nr:ParB/RepB/Spo0J family partition protein [Acinetobacter brisouii]